MQPRARQSTRRRNSVGHGPAHLHIIDVDSHLTEPHDLWTRSAPAAYVDRVPHVVDVDGVPMWSIDGVLLDNRRVNLSSVIRPDGEKVAGVEFFDFERDEIHPGVVRHGRRGSRSSTS